MPNESIFKSAFRAFFRSFFVIIGIALACFVLFFIVTICSPQRFVTEKTTLTIDVDDQGKREILPLSSPVVLKIAIEGVIGSKKLHAKSIRAQLLDSRSGPLKNGRVKALFLYINSPGGTAVDSFNIYKSLVDYKEKYGIPIYAFVDGYCASGGMMIACAADKIYSSPIGVVGSVGVKIGPNFNVVKLMEKVGVEQKTLTQGKGKDFLNPFRPWTEGEDAPLEEIIAYDYMTFVDIVSRARPKLTRKKLIDEYGAKVFDPEKAEQLGYIDHGKSSYSQAMRDLTEKAGIAKNTPYQVVQLRLQTAIFSDLAEGNSSLIGTLLRRQFGHREDIFPFQPLYLYTRSDAK